MVVKQIGIALLLSLVSFAYASESSIIAFRAQKSLDAGKFAKGYSQLERALLASRKESDLLSEGRILTSMAQIRIMSLDFNLADSLLSLVRESSLDNSSNAMFAQAKIALANAKNEFDIAVKICNNISEESVKKIEKPIKAALYSECAIAYAGNIDYSQAQESLKLVGKNSDKKGGFYAYTAARIASLNNKTEADSLYQVAEEKSIQANRSYTTATILWEKSKLKTTPKKEADDLKLRCKNAFELMGLPNNAKRCSD